MVEKVTELDEAIKSMKEEYGRKVSVDEVAERLGISEDDIEDILSNRSEETSKETDFAMQAAVKEVFCELKDEERLIVALSVFGGYTGEEIAGILEKNPSTIRSKYRRALKKMREKLEG